MEYLHKIDPNATVEGAKRILASIENKTVANGYRPKSAAHYQVIAAMIRRDISKLEAA